MGLFDIFSNSDASNAAAAQTAGLNAGYQQLQPWLQSGNAYLGQNYAAGLQPSINNYNTAQGGVNQLGALLGINPTNSLQLGGSATPNGLANGNTVSTGAGPGTPGGVGNGALGGGSSPANMQDVLANLPGYQFALNQGAQNVLRNQASTGQLNSGATDLDLQKQGQGLASQNYFNYVNQLMPFLQSSNTNAQNIGGLYGQLGQGINANQNTGGAAAYGTQVGIGNANAQADYAKLAQSGAMFGGLMGLGGAALKAFA